MSYCQAHGAFRQLKCPLCERSKLTDCDAMKPITIQDRREPRVVVVDIDELRETLIMTVGLLRGWHEDGTTWSEYDTEVERRIAAFQQVVEAGAAGEQVELSDNHNPSGSSAAHGCPPAALRELCQAISEAERKAIAVEEALKADGYSYELRTEFHEWVTRSLRKDISIIRVHFAPALPADNVPALRPPTETFQATTDAPGGSQQQAG